MEAKGFTLIETMIVCVIAGLILTIALPGFSTYRQTLALKQARSQLYSDLRLARQLAVTRRAPVYIRFANGSTTTNVTTYRMHVDTDNDRIVDSNEILKDKKMPKNTKISSVALAPVDTLCFDISGILWPGHNGGRLILINDRSKRDTLMVSTAGIIYRP